MAGMSEAALARCNKMVIKPSDRPGHFAMLTIYDQRHGNRILAVHHVRTLNDTVRMKMAMRGKYNIPPQNIEENAEIWAERQESALPEGVVRRRSNVGYDIIEPVKR